MFFLYPYKIFFGERGLRYQVSGFWHFEIKIFDSTTKVEANE